MELPEPIELTGKTVEEAKLRALEQLGLPEDQVEIEILEEGSKSFLGLVHNPARIRVTAKLKGGKAEKPAPGASSPGFLADLSAAESAAQEREGLPSLEVPPQEDSAAASDSSGSILIEKVFQFTQKLLDAMGLDVQAVLKDQSSEQVEIEIVGSDTAILIGKHGQTLSEMQFLISHIVNRRSERRMRILLDAEGYRERHEEFLRDLALSLARDVKRKRQEAIVFEARDARERRIIHMALADHPDVYTYSEGEGSERKVVISPKS